MVMGGFSVTEEQQRRQNYLREIIGEGTPVVAIGYKDGIVLTTKSTSVRDKIYPAADGLAFGGIKK